MVIVKLVMVMVVRKMIVVVMMMVVMMMSLIPNEACVWGYYGDVVHIHQAGEVTPGLEASFKWKLSFYRTILFIYRLLCWHPILIKRIIVKKFANGQQLICVKTDVLDRQTQLNCIWILCVCVNKTHGRQSVKPDKSLDGDDWQFGLLGDDRFSWWGDYSEFQQYQKRR